MAGSSQTKKRHYVLALWDNRFSDLFISTTAHLDDEMIISTFKHRAIEKEFHKKASGKLFRGKSSRGILIREMR